MMFVLAEVPEIFASGQGLLAAMNGLQKVMFSSTIFAATVLAAERRI
jgi:hypothetical protein